LASCVVVCIIKIVPVHHQTQPLLSAKNLFCYFSNVRFSFISVKQNLQLNEKLESGVSMAAICTEHKMNKQMVSDITKTKVLWNPHDFLMQKTLATMQKLAQENIWSKKNE